MNGETTELTPKVVAELRALLPAAAAHTVEAVLEEVPEYSRAAIDAETVRTIEASVQLALATFLRLAIDTNAGDSAARLAPALEGAYALGRGEARVGRTMEALLAAYRVGARAAWQEVSALLVRRRVAAATVARFAELVFAYIDELSGASAAGHRDELATSGRVRAQLFERLAHALVIGETPDQLGLRADRAGWSPPDTITVVVLRSAHTANVTQLLDARTLRLAGDLAPGLASDELAVLLVPDAHRSRPALQAALSGRGAIMGPTRSWTDTHVSYQRVLRARELLPVPGDEPLDTDDHLVTLIVTADPDALHDLRARALEPLAELRPATAERLTETLRAWLLHQGRRDDVAAALNVHPQTVRYRMTQLREMFGARLTDPDATLELIVALTLDE
jgi:PucR C-terminal helix-turn-helix domain